MGAKNLIKINPYNQPTANPAYFYPLTLTLDPEEKSNFLSHFNEKYRQDVGNQALYSPMGNAARYFPKTVEQTKQFLSAIGLTMRNFTVFVAPPTNNINDTRNIHVDGVKLPDGTDVILEARLSYYEMSDMPGVVRWFPKEENYINWQERVLGKIESNIWTLPWIQDLKQKKINWEDAPEWTFATSTNVPSGIIRTNLPHHVIQGGGNRLTISAQIVWPTGSPVGVWAHIHNNKHLLGV